MTGSTDLGRAPAKMKLPAAKTVIQAGMIALLALGLSACGGKGFLAWRFMQGCGLNTA